MNKILLCLAFVLGACADQKQPEGAKEDGPMVEDVKKTFVADFDGDGEEEYYEFEGDVKIEEWLGVDTLYVGKLAYYDDEKLKYKVDVARNLRIVQMKPRAYMVQREQSMVTAFDSVLYNGEWIPVGEMDTEGSNGWDFKMYVHHYGTMIMDNIEQCGFNPTYWGYVTPEGDIREYGGILLDERMLEKFVNGKEWLKRIKQAEEGKRWFGIDEIWYRANGIINVNFSVVSAEKEEGTADEPSYDIPTVDLRHVTLRYDDLTITGQTIMGEDLSADCLSCDGHYRSAEFPDKATYPQVPDFLRSR